MATDDTVATGPALKQQVHLGGAEDTEEREALSVTTTAAWSVTAALFFLRVLRVNRHSLSRRKSYRSGSDPDLT
jgi:hypothetical protein